MPHKDPVVAKQKSFEYREKNREKLKLISRRYREKNKSRIKKRLKLYALKNPEKIKLAKLKQSLKKRYKVMDLQNPMIDESDKQYIEEYLTTYTPQYQPQEFIKMYEQDRLGNLIRNVNVWLKECFENLK